MDQLAKSTAIVVAIFASAIGLSWFIPNFQDFVRDWGPVITAALMSLAIWNFLAGRGSRGKIDLIVAATQTKSAGKFPEYMERVISILAEAKSSIHIATAVLTTGVFSNAPIHQRYRGMLTFKAPDVDLQIVCGDSGSRRRFDTGQFVDRYKGGFDEFKRGNQGLLNSFLNLNWLKDGDVPDIQALTLDTFEANFDLLHHDMVTSLRRAGVPDSSLNESRNDLTVWFWVADKRRAIIAIPLAKGRLLAQAIETVDPALIEPLLELHAQLSKEAMTQNAPGSG